MTRLPRPTGREVVKAMQKLGFELHHVKGSHHVLRHADGRRAVVPVHAGEDIGPGLLRSILRDCNISVDQFVEVL